MSGNQTLNYYKAFIKNSKKLKKQEKEILSMRIENKTLREIAKVYGYKTTEIIRRKEAKALFKLFRFIVKKMFRSQ